MSVPRESDVRHLKGISWRIVAASSTIALKEETPHWLTSCDIAEVTAQARTRLARPQAFVRLKIIF
jgi:hypothetical protein